MAVIKLTERAVRSLPVPKDGSLIYWDQSTKGFGCRVTPNGVRSFVLDYRAGGRHRRYTIGQYDDWSVAAAREEAQRLRRAVDAGSDPMGDRHARHRAPTVQELFERYCDEHLPKKRERSAADDKSMWRRDILPKLGKFKVADLRFTDVDRLHREITRSGRPVRANRVVEVLRKALNLAVLWDWIDRNPAVGVERNPEERRERYLKGEEIVRLCRAMQDHPQQQSVNAIRLLMLTGARRGEVLSSTWDQFDLEAGIWIKPSGHTKQKREHRVPLSAPALQLLTDMKTGATSGFLFPNPNGTGHQVDLKRTWQALCKEAGLVEVVGHKTNRKGDLVPILRHTARVHDLRHTYASILASAGASLPLIGSLLGHTQPATTARYAHLLDDPQRRATESVGAAIEAATSGTTAKVIPMKKKELRSAD